MHGDEKRRSFHHFAIVDVAGVDPRRSAADPAIYLRWSYAHAAEEGLDRNLDGIAEVRQHASPVEWNDLGPLIRELVLKKTEAGAKSVVREWRRQFDLSNANFQHVSGLGPFHVDRPSENVPPRPSIGHLFKDVPKGF